MTSKHYKYFQPNEKDTKDKFGDCAVRSICKAEKLPINIVLERFMQGYINEDFKLEMKYFHSGK